MIEWLIDRTEAVRRVAEKIHEAAVSRRGSALANWDSESAQPVLV